MIIHELPPGRAYGESVRVVLVDKDPMSRQFLLAALAAVSGIEVVVGELESLPAPGDHNVIIVAWTLQRTAHLSRLRKLAADGSRVLVLGVDWTQQTIRDVLEAGACGIVVKTLDIDGLAAAVRAVASGHIVISPALLSVYLGSDTPPSDQQPDDATLQLLATLTSREIEVLGLLAQSMSTVEAAEKLGVSLATVKSHVSHALHKLGVRNRVEAVLLVKRLRPTELAARVRGGGRTPP